ncbi:uncharacterized protein LOC110870703 [Helianthus annuus]|uniref:uncharacterized protein LOC110870703 n=1 Tax=Helianthus annuus TaxID=4232 RepID=UPI0016533455|nr:uncharacterized protein LOC110870703 [Helianthus annuus]
MENEFYNAFASPMTITQNTMLENETGTTQKLPKLMSIEEPVKDDGKKVDIKDLSVEEKQKYKNENLMVSLLQQAIKEEILILLQHNGSAHSIWKELKSKKTDLKAFVAQKVEDDDNDYWANSMKEYLKYLAKRDAEKARIAKKKVEKQDDRDDDYWADKMKEHLKFLSERDAERRKGNNDEEEVRVIKVKEVPAFEIKKEADVKKMSENCENCETLKKYNNELIHNMNRIYPTVEGMKAFEEETAEVKKFETKEDIQVKISECHVQELQVGPTGNEAETLAQERAQWDTGG